MTKADLHLRVCQLRDYLRAQRALWVEKGHGATWARRNLDELDRHLETANEIEAKVRAELPPRAPGEVR